MYMCIHTSIIYMNIHIHAFTSRVVVENFIHNNSIVSLIIQLYNCQLRCILIIFCGLDFCGSLCPRKCFHFVSKISLGLISSKFICILIYVVSTVEFQTYSTLYKVHGCVLCYSESWLGLNRGLVLFRGLGYIVL